MRQLFDENQGLVFSTVGRIWKKFPWVRRHIGDIAEANSLGLIALWKASKLYDASTGFRFSTYAVNAIQREVIRAAVPSGAIKVPRERLLAVITGGEATGINKAAEQAMQAVGGNLVAITPDARVIANDVDRDMVQFILSALSRSELRLVEMRFGLVDGQERTILEIADAFGVSRNTISARLEKITDRLVAATVAFRSYQGGMEMGGWAFYQCEVCEQVFYKNVHTDTCPSCPDTAAAKLKKFKGPKIGKENDVVNICLQWLQLKGVMCWRNNNVGVWDPTRKRFRASSKGLKGISDIAGILPSGRAMYIECKAATGVLSTHQQEFIERVRSSNGVALVVRCLEELEAGLRDHLPE